MAVSARFIAKDAEGMSKKVDFWEFAVPEGVDLSAWAGASSGLLDGSDVGEISAAMHPGSVAIVAIYENPPTKPADEEVTAGPIEDRRQGCGRQLRARPDSASAAATLGSAGPGRRGGRDTGGNSSNRKPSS
jgi:hypothetical protein